MAVDSGTRSLKAGESAGDMTPGREFWTGRWAWAGLAIVLLAIACATNATTGGGIDGVVEEPKNEGLAVDRIVYVDDGGDIFTINGDGTGQLRLTGAGTADLGRAAGLLSRPTERDNLYTWPTWSPDGTKIAASHVGVADRQAVVTVEVIDAATGQSRTVFTNDIPALVAQGAPHYLYWSPDSTALGILAGGAGWAGLMGGGRGGRVCPGSRYDGRASVLSLEFRRGDDSHPRGRGIVGRAEAIRCAHASAGVGLDRVPGAGPVTG